VDDALLVGVVQGVGDLGDQPGDGVEVAAARTERGGTSPSRLRGAGAGHVRPGLGEIGGKAASIDRGLRRHRRRTRSQLPEDQVERRPSISSIA
jgi:hypothetical protein